MNTIRFYDNERDTVMTKVERGIRGFCRARNLFACEDLIDDCLSMVAIEMCKTDFKQKPAFYVSIGKQLAVTGARERSVMKRRVNFDVNIRVNIDDAFEVGFEDERLENVIENKEERIIHTIEEKYGKELALYIEGLLKGSSIKDRRGNELSEARIALKIKNLFRGKDISELKELIKSFENE